MGKMKMNLNEFALAKAKTDLNPVEVIPEIIEPVATSIRDVHNEGQHTIQVKYDMITNIVSDVCGVLQETTKAVRDIMVEKEKTKQIQMVSAARIREAEEQTKQVWIQETQATERAKSQYLADIQKAEFELQKELAIIQKDKENIISDERKFNKALDIITLSVQNIIMQNKIYMENFQYSDRIHENNNQLIRFAEQIVNLYKG